MMEINMQELRALIKEVWAKLYFKAWGDEQEGIDKMYREIEEELDKFEKDYAKKMEEEYARREKI